MLKYLRNPCAMYMIALLSVACLLTWAIATALQPEIFGLRNYRVLSLIGDPEPVGVLISGLALVQLALCWSPRRWHRALGFICGGATWMFLTLALGLSIWPQMPPGTFIVGVIALFQFWSAAVTVR